MNDLDNKTTVEAGVLSNLVDLFFKGMGKILDYAAEYQEEMGVLKSITKVPVADKDGEEYTMVVKLAPVRDKEDTFYVETEILDENNKPVDKFNVDEINKKAVLLNRQTESTFNDLLQKVLRENHLMRLDKDADINEYDFYAVYTNDEDTEYEFHVTERPAKGAKDKFVVDIDTDATVTEFPSNKVYRESEIDEAIDSWLESNEMFRLTEEERGQASQEEPKEEPVQESKSIKVSLRRVNGSTDVELVASKINCNITAAADMLSAVAYDSEFLDQLSEEPATFLIVDDGEDYDVEQTDEPIEYDSLLGEFVSMLAVCADNIHYILTCRDVSVINSPGFSAIGDMSYSIDGLLSDAKRWYFAETKQYVPNPIPPSKNVEYIHIDNIISTEEDVAPYMKLACQQLADVLDMMYPNLDHEYQKRIDDTLLPINDLLARLDVVSFG